MSAGARVQIQCESISRMHHDQPPERGLIWFFVIMIVFFHWWLYELSNLKKKKTFKTCLLSFIFLITDLVYLNTATWFGAKINSNCQTEHNVWMYTTFERQRSRHPLYSPRIPPSINMAAMDGDDVRSHVWCMYFWCFLRVRTCGHAIMMVVIWVHVVRAQLWSTGWSHHCVHDINAAWECP